MTDYPPPLPPDPPVWKVTIGKAVSGAAIWVAFKIGKAANWFVYGPPPKPIISWYDDNDHSKPPPAP